MNMDKPSNSNLANYITVEITQTNAATLWTNASGIKFTQAKKKGDLCGLVFFPLRKSSFSAIR